MALTINIHDIRHTKSAQLRDKLVLYPGELELPKLPGITWKEFSFAYGLTNASNLFVLQGELESAVALKCSRCLKPMDYLLKVAVLEQFSPNPQGDDDIHKFCGEVINISGVLRDNILLNLPVKPLCSPDCRGLCPHCGIELNRESCDCNPKHIDPRLAVLEKLIRK